MTLAIAAPPESAITGLLMPGFVLLVAGLAVMSRGRGGLPIQSPKATRRALAYALIYGLAAAAFSRVIGAALLGQERSPWLLALSDVIFVTMGLFVLVVALFEGHSAREYGFRPVTWARLAVTTLMGIGGVVLYAYDAYSALATHRVPVNTDTAVFAALASTLGSAIPEETLFRGYLMSSLEGRYRAWSRIAISGIAFTVFRALRYAPGLGLGTPAWLLYVFGVVLPLGLWWGLMRELAGGSVWPSLSSHVLLEFGVTLAGASPALL